MARKFSRMIRDQVEDATSMVMKVPDHMPHMEVPEPVHHAKKILLQDFTDIVGRTLCMCVVITQGALLDYYLIAYNSPAWYPWLFTDVLSIGFIGYSLWTSYRHFRRSRRRGHPERVEKIPAFVSWAVYATCLVLRVSVIFKHTAHLLTYDDALGPNCLKSCVAATAVVFLLFVLAHHDAEPLTPRNTYIGFLCGAATLDIFDSAAFLNTLFTLETRILLPFDAENAIIAFACINLFLPTVALVRLNNDLFGRKPGDFTIRLVHYLVYILLVNVPFVVMRLYLYRLQQDISVFLIKNFIGIFAGVRTLYYDCLHRFPDGFTSKSPPASSTAASPRSRAASRGQRSTDIELGTEAESFGAARRCDSLGGPPPSNLIDVVRMARSMLNVTGDQRGVPGGRLEHLRETDEMELGAAHSGGGAHRMAYSAINVSESTPPAATHGEQFFPREEHPRSTGGSAGGPGASLLAPIEPMERSRTKSF